MSKKTYILSVIISLFSISTFAQINADIIRPSVNADQFGLAVKAETALSKGQLSLSIPLMELKGKGYDLPISLTFYSGDVTFSTEASPVGLGWALMAGGVITKTIRGDDDFDTTYSNKEHLYNGNYIFNNWNVDDNFINIIQVDPMPDEYTYSLPGHSGTIDISVNGNTTSMSLYPDESYIIEPTPDGFCITADNGTKFYFEDAETRTIAAGAEYTKSVSWFLTRIETVKNGFFDFTYETEEYYDLSTADEDGHCYHKFRTKRIASVTSDFGTVTFDAEVRLDRGNQSIEQGLKSKRIKKIELRDEAGVFVKGFELDNSGLFESLFPDPYSENDYRHKLSSVTQYDSVGNYLPPYEFSYSYKFHKSKLAEAIHQNGECLPRDSWTGYVAYQVYVGLDGSGKPICRMINPDSPNTFLEGITIKPENIGPTSNDYFCLTEVNYPNGATEEFIYENHHYSKVNMVNASCSYNWIQGKRLALRKRYGSEHVQRTEYVYKLHDSNYNANGASSGVMTNPSIHYATYYTPEPDRRTWRYLASRVVSGKAFNSFMGPPVCYTEVEEVEKDEYGDILNRTIHYYAPQIVSPPVNYICVKSHRPSLYESSLLEVGNRIYGTKTGYTGNMAYMNNENHTYMAYPVGEFYDVAFWTDQPIKEVFIGLDQKVRSIKEYSYYRGYYNNKYGYKIESKDYYQSGFPSTLEYTAHLISMSEYIPHRFRIHSINTTRYNYHENEKDSICETYTVSHNKGRVSFTSYSRSNEGGNNESNITSYYFPGDILNIIGNSASPTIEAMSKLVERNNVADPIKTVMIRNGQIIGGECKDYQILSDTLMPMLKSIYRIKNTESNSSMEPTISGNDINYHADLYKEGEVMTYDEDMNPEHVRLNNTQDRIYVWGYGGRFPIAVIDNMNHATFQAANSLRSQLQQLSTYRKIETVDSCASLRNLNASIRAMLPDSVHITTYTYDPYFGMTSETDDSNLGVIYTYDTFGRLSAKYDAYFRKTEEYNYHLYLQ